MMAWAKALDAARRRRRARHIAPRLREFRNDQADAFFAPCDAAHRPSAAAAVPVPAADAELQLRGLPLAARRRARRRLGGGDPVARLAAALLQHADRRRSPCRGRPPCTCRRSSAGRPARRSALPSRRRCGRASRPATVQRTLLAGASRSNSTATRVIGSGWHSGISSGGALGAPGSRRCARRRSRRPSSALADAISASVAGCMRITPLARATRCVSALAATSTMWAWPCGVEVASAGWRSAAGMAMTEGKRLRCIIRARDAGDTRVRPARSDAPSHDFAVPVHSMTERGDAPARASSPRCSPARWPWPARARGRRPARRASCPRSATPARPTSASAPSASSATRSCARSARDPDYLDDPLLLEYLQTHVAAAGRRGALARQHHRRHRPALRLGAVPGARPSVNAFALPGGYVGVHLGLIAMTATRDELASVLAHELSHVTQRHIARSIAQQSKRHRWSAWRRCVLGVLAASRAASSPDAAHAVDRRQPGRRRSRASSTSRATWSARPTASASAGA